MTVGERTSEYVKIRLLVSQISGFHGDALALYTNL